MSKKDKNNNKKDNQINPIIMNKGFRFGLFILFALVIYTFTMDAKKTDKKQVKDISYTEFVSNLDNKQIDEVSIDSKFATGKLKDGTEFKTEVIITDNFMERIEKSDAKVSVIKSKEQGKFSWKNGVDIFSILVWLVIIFLIFRAFKGAGKMGGFDKGIGKKIEEQKNPKTFDDVKGCDEAKQDVAEIVDFLRNPTKFTRIGGRIPKGFLLVGPPGTGKTLLARAIAGEAKVPFFSISGSDFVEMFVGVGASRVRSLFNQGKENAPCIIFIDEIDAVGRKRGVGYGGGNDEREQTLNQLLVEMDGFDSNEGIILMAATNRADVLDDALLRPGRFDRQIHVPLPDIKGREEIIKVYLKKVKIKECVDAKTIARGTSGFSGAELENLVNEAAINAARFNKIKITQEDFEVARDKILMGAERRSYTMDKDELKRTAYHEAGHALVCVLTEDKHKTPVHKATIIPRGGALGMVQHLAEKDMVYMTKAAIIANIQICMAGRVAEEIFFGKENITTGASSDIRQATAYARKSIVEWGMNEKLGPVYYEESSLGYHTTGSRTNISDETAKEIDTQLKNMLEYGYKDAKDMILKHKKQLENIGEALLKYETLTGAEIKQIIEGKKLDKKITKSEKKQVIEIKSSLPISQKPKVVKNSKAKKKPTSSVKKTDVKKQENKK